MAKHKADGLVNEVRKRLDAKIKPIRTKRTLVLSKENYDKFERLCRGDDLYPSEVVDEFIALFVESKSRKT